MHSGRMILSACLLAIACTVAGLPSALAGVVDFEDLELAEESYWNGPDPDGTLYDNEWGDPSVLGAFTSGGVRFVNRHSTPSWGTYWSGFAYSNSTDTTTPGYLNQFSAFAGSGARGSKTFGVAGGSVDNLDAGDHEDLQRLPYFAVPDGYGVANVRVTNTTYAALAMRHGDSYAEPFAQGDWFKITAYGIDAAGDLLAHVPEFFLADFQSLDAAERFILDQWTEWDLSVLADARRVYFNLTSSDVSNGWMNTPGYFALDDLTLMKLDVVPEPATGVLVLLGMAAVAPLLCRRQSAVRRR